MKKKDSLFTTEELYSLLNSYIEFFNNNDNLSKLKDNQKVRIITNITYLLFHTQKKIQEGFDDEIFIDLHYSLCRLFFDHLKYLDYNPEEEYPYVNQGIIGLIRHDYLVHTHMHQIKK